ncbi:DUF308 domain-containing protein [Pseudonocardia phyllosphaerae]|uniref:DUF308 domain-containing protein n=1 Tax=Pseudonocardia phyllosphaerae TaxID=3390502 RepID=UPI00397C5980
MEPHGGSGRDEEFESIVAGWRSEGSVPAWPAERPDPAPEGSAPPPAQDETGPGDTGPDVVDAGADPDDHYHPPEPPPLPRLGPPAVVGGGLIGTGLLLAGAPELVGAGGTWPLPLGLVLIAAGLAWLLLRLWTADSGPEDDDLDDGSRL